MIGEPIVRRQLQKMLDSKRLEQIPDHESRLKYLEEELKKLKGE